MNVLFVGPRGRPGDRIEAYDFGVRADGDGIGGGTDNYAALTALGAYCAANPGSKVSFPQGIICTTGTDWSVNVPTIDFDFSGALLQSIRSDGAYERYPWQPNGDPFINRVRGSGVETGRITPYLTNTIEPGDKVITFKVAAEVNSPGFDVGSKIVIYSYDQQAGGFPFNYRYHEFGAVIVAKDAGAGTITLDRPCLHYHSDASYGYSDTGGTIGPVGVIPLNRGTQFQYCEYMRVRNLRVLRNPYDLTPHATEDGEDRYHSSLVPFCGIHKLEVDGLECDEVWNGQGYSHELWRLNCISAQPDKLLTSLAFHSGKITDISAGQSIWNIYLGRDLTIKSRMIQLAPHRLFVNGTRFPRRDVNPISLADSLLFQELVDIRNASFEREGIVPIFAGTDVAGVADAPDKRGGPNSVTVAAIPGAGSFSSAFGSGSFRKFAGRGTVLHRRDRAPVTVTVTIASPGVISGITMPVGQPFVWLTTGALPTGIIANPYAINASIYYALASGQFAATPGGSAINTSGSQSGTHQIRELSDGATFTVDRIDYDAANGGRDVCTYRSDDTPRVGDILGYHATMKLVASGNIRTREHNRNPWHCDGFAAESYVNLDDGINDSTFDVVWRNLAYNGATGYPFEIDGYLQEIEVNIEKAANIGGADKALAFTVTSPWGTTGPLVGGNMAIDTSTRGWRLVTRTSAGTALGADSLGMLTGSYVKGFRITVAASQNTGNDGFKGWVRIRATRRPE